jgi:hypothetical protein
LSARFGLSGLRLSACQVSRSEMTLIRVRAPLAFSRAHNCLTTLHIAEMLKSLRSRRAEVLTSQYSPGSRRARRGWQRRRGRPSRSRVSWRRGSSQGPRSPRQARWRRCSRPRQESGEDCAYCEKYADGAGDPAAEQRRASLLYWIIARFVFRYPCVRVFSQNPLPLAVVYRHDRAYPVG